ncbi:MAG: UDP-N-acetylmuramate--L-alanine ligase [Rickettsiales bacterium TMED289]|nr:MAG: UDP-N-acetylmuramate--L-alanine ligase [Rickettsiales bacterium TMED289]
MKIKLAKTENIHFIGIGGIGMSGLAIIMKGLGFRVQGSDLYLSKNVERLKKRKIKTFLKHKKDNVKNTTIIVISSAIKKNNPEIVEARRRNLPIYKRGEMLGHIVSLMKNIVVAGSHGKTTTTSLISSIFSKTKIDPTIINGGVLNSNGNSAKLGKSDWGILEADESDGSFLDIPTTYSIITNVDKEHLDFYTSMKKLRKDFIKFIEKTPSFGKSYICIDDLENKNILKNLNTKNFLTYGVNKKSNFKIKNVRHNIKFSSFDLSISVPGKKRDEINKIQIPIIGLHNIRNATAAVAVCYTIGISKKIIKNGLRKFQGVQRRFNHIFTYRNSKFIDDYAHHPTEISSVLESIKLVYKNEKLVCIFQPHRVSRLNNLKNEFSKCFKSADYLILCPIYKAGENIKLRFNYEKFAKEIIKNSGVQLFLVKNSEDLIKFVKQNIFGKNIVIGMGAGTISNWIRMMPEKL